MVDHIIKTPQATAGTAKTIAATWNRTLMPVGAFPTGGAKTGPGTGRPRGRTNLPRPHNKGAQCGSRGLMLHRAILRWVWVKADSHGRLVARQNIFGLCQRIRRSGQFVESRKPGGPLWRRRWPPGMRRRPVHTDDGPLPTRPSPSIARRPNSENSIAGVPSGSLQVGNQVGACPTAYFFAAGSG